MLSPPYCDFSFFFNDTATTEIYTLSLHDALPISITRTPSASWKSSEGNRRAPRLSCRARSSALCRNYARWRSEEHTSELQSHLNLVCRLLLEKKKNKYLCYLHLLT